MAGARPRGPWWAWVFGLALALRLGWLFLADEPLLYAHQQQYLRSALEILDNPQPWRFVFTSDEWRRWLGTWTIAPLYQLFVAAAFAIFGKNLLPLQLLQCLMDALAAVGVGAIGRSASVRHGAWAGAAYAVYWPSVQMASGTLTENLHTPLLVLAFVLLLRAQTPRSYAAAGLVLGVSALARSVGSAFVPLAALAILLRRGMRRGMLPALLFVAGALTAILPWAARNAFLVGDPVLIDSIGVYNLWEDNAFKDGQPVVADHRLMQSWVFRDELPEPERRRRATAEVVAGISAYPELFARKVWLNFAHFLRPDMLHQLLVVELPDTPLRYALAIAFDDLLLLATLPFFAIFLVAGWRSPAWGTLTLWTGYYLFMVVVVFHNEIRYRSALMPMAFAGALAGVGLLLEREQRRRTAVRLAAVLGFGLSLWAVAPAARSAFPALEAAATLRGMGADVARGDLAAARQRAESAARLQPRSARPWLALGHALAWSERPTEALAAYRHAAQLRRDNWIPTLVLPRLLRDAGQEEPGARVATKRAHEFSGAVDPWLALELAWRELPPPRADEIDIGRLDYGAVRGFFGPRGFARWSRARAWLRLQPIVAAPAYDVTLEMGSPEPSPFASPEVTVRATGASPVRFRLRRQIAPYVFRAAPALGETLLVSIEAATWIALGQPAEQGVRVERMTLAPAR